MRDVDPQVAEFFEHVESAVFAEEFLDGVVQPVVGQAFPGGYRMSGSAHLGRA